MTIRRSRAILRAATRTLHANPRLVWFTVMSAIVSAIVVGIGGAIAWLGSHPEAWLPGGLDTAPPDAMQSRSMLVFGLATWFGTHLVAPFFGVALARATLDAMASRPWTVSDTLRGTGQRITTIATFAVLNASVGGLLSRIGGGGKGRQRGPLARATAKVLGLAWWAATYLVMPVIAREPRSGFAAVSRSATLFRDTWREAFIGRLVLGWLWVPAFVIATVPVALCLLLKVQHAGLFALAIVLPAFALVLLGVVLQTLDTIYRCALYVFATEGVVPEPFDDPDLHEVWCARVE
jgi:hypothetical protein